MFFIFGWGRQTVKLHGPVSNYQCPRCHNSEPWKLYTRKTWITLFFIPVIPYSFDHLLMCPICNHGISLTMEQFSQMKPVAQCNQALLQKDITEEEHAIRMRTLSAEEFVHNNNNNNMTGKTETQINYLRQMRELEENKQKQLDPVHQD